MWENALKKQTQASPNVTVFDAENFNLSTNPLPISL